MIEYRVLRSQDIDGEIFSHFIRHQAVSKCWRKIDGQWCIRDIAFIDDWSPEDYAFLVKCLKNTANTGGLVLGAFSEHMLKGFVSVESGFLGKEHEYLDLSSIHVSEDMRFQGMGRELFTRAKQWAKKQGAKKLYISAHSAVETQAFYHAMGCVEAKEYNKAHVEQEPCDCQMECEL